MPAPTKAYIISRFNSVVASLPSRNNATYHAGNFPNIAQRTRLGAFPLGSRTEPNKTVADIGVTGMMATNIFEILHNLAMELTRVRKARNVHLVDNRSDNGAVHAVVGSPTLTALHPRHAQYFDFPGSHKNVGDQINLSEIESFLSSLRTRVQYIRSSDDHLFEIVSCHSSCHSSCHGSRARR